MNGVFEKKEKRVCAFIPNICGIKIGQSIRTRIGSILH
jgi:hypothetical protein